MGQTRADLERDRAIQQIAKNTERIATALEAIAAKRKPAPVERLHPDEERPDLAVRVDCADFPKRTAGRAQHELADQIRRAQEIEEEEEQREIERELDRAAATGEAPELDWNS